MLFVLQELSFNEKLFQLGSDAIILIVVDHKQIKYSLDRLNSII